MCIACGDDSPIVSEPDIEVQEQGKIVIVSGNSIVTSVFESEFSVKIEQNTSYDIRINGDWIHQCTTRALNSETLYFKVDFNKTKQKREGEISFIKKEDGEEQTIQIRQRGGIWINCSIDTSAQKQSWTTTDTIGVCSSSYNNEPFIFCEGDQFVTDRDGTLKDVTAAYYPYHSVSEREISESDILNYLIADASFLFEPVAFPITITASNELENSKCRLVSNRKIFGHWSISDGIISSSSNETEKEFTSGSCVFTTLAKTKENIGIIVKNNKGEVTAENCYIEMNEAKKIDYKYVTSYEALDMEKNANCYIIDRKGHYCFALRDAAGGQRWKGDGCYAEVIWSDFADDFINNPTIVGDIVFFDADMSNDKQGNAGLALKDAQGNILWSWHIWLTDQTDFRTIEKGKFLNIPLGSITNSRNFQYGDHYHALLYQYGRKDPFPNQGPNSEYLAITDEGLNVYDNSGGFGTFYRRDWHQGIYDESCPMIAAESNDGNFGYYGTQPENIKWNVVDWDDVNNPCPPGFSIPKGDLVWKYMTGKEGQYATWPGHKVKDLEAVEIYNNGLLNMTENYWFPAVKGRTPLYGIEDQYHPYCAIPSESLRLWVKLTYINIEGFTYATIVEWLPDNMGGVEILRTHFGEYNPIVCVKD